MLEDRKFLLVKSVPLFTQGRVKKFEGIFATLAFSKPSKSQTKTKHLH